MGLLGGIDRVSVTVAVAAVFVLLSKIPSLILKQVQLFETFRVSHDELLLYEYVWA
jgi:hypothetical protein